MRDTNSERYTGYLVPIVLLAAFVLRLLNIRFGYPLQLHPDEPVIVQSALGMVATGDLNPHTFLYPSLNIYLNALLYKIAGLFGMPPAITPVIEFHLIGRALSTLFSTVTIYGVYAIGRRLFGAWAGIAAACFIAASSLHVGNAYLVTVDTGMALWSTLACLMAVLIHCEGPRLRYYLAGGIFVGLAVGSKYTAFPAFLPILAAHLCRAREEGRYLDLNIISSVAAVPAVFLLTTPYALLDYPAFLGALAHQKSEYSIGHAGAESPFGFSLPSYCRYLLSEGYGLLPSLLALAGGTLLYRRSRCSLALVLACPLVLLAFLGMYKVHFPRNVVTLIPFMALLSGCAVVAAAEWCGRRFGATRPGGTALACGVLMTAVALQGQVAADARTTRENRLPDTRWISLLWSRENIPAGAAVGREHYTPPLEEYSAGHHVVRLGYFGVMRNSAMLSHLDFVIASSADYSRFLDEPGRYPAENAGYRDFFMRNRLIREFSADGQTMTGPTIRIYQVSRPLP